MRKAAIVALSLASMLVLWSLLAAGLGPRLLPAPSVVAATIFDLARSGELVRHLAASTARTAAAFTLALTAGAAIGLALGRSERLDDVAMPWVTVLLNVPALVVIVLAYIWFGLTEVAAIGAVALNKLPNTIITVREGARALDPALDDLSKVFRFSRLSRLRNVVAPQLAPYLMAAARNGLSLAWKIVLVVELLGRSNGVGFAIGTAFQLFDVGRILAYALAFVVLMLAIDWVVLQPVEQRANRWRRRA